MGNFLLIDLNEAKTKKLAETITSDTSRRILNYLTEKEDSEANIAKKLKIPISTVHYHLQKLQQASLVEVKEFHYSKKGREVNHYKLANKYIIIAPKNVPGLREKLRSILPVAIGLVGISAVIKFLQNAGLEAVPEIMQSSAKAADEMVAEAAPMMAARVIEPVTQQPDLALWFLLGGVSVILIYLLIEFVRSKIS